MQGLSDKEFERLKLLQYVYNRRKLKIINGKEYKHVNHVELKGKYLTSCYIDENNEVWIENDEKGDY